MVQWVCLAAVVVATVVGVGVFARGVARIVATLRLGRPAPQRWRPVGRRLATLVTELVGHGRFQHRPVVRVAHWVVMVSFPLLFVTLVTGYGQVVDPRFALPVIGHLAPLEWLVEAFAWLSLVGIVALTALRLRIRPRPSDDEARQRRSRFFGSNLAQAYFVEATVAAVVVAVLVLRGLEYALGSQGGEPWATAAHFPLTAWLGSAWVGAPTGALEAAVVVAATVKILVSMSWFVVVGMQPTMGVAWHRFLAVVNVYARREPDGRPALGPLVPMTLPDGSAFDLEKVDELPEDARLGVSTIEDLSWKGLLDLSTCTECGRCQDVCPAWATGKALSPKLFVLGLRDHAAGATDDANLLGADLLTAGAVDYDALWDCTTCGACVQQCPVDIEHVDTLVGVRRAQVLMESRFPRELGQTFTKLERQGNPWGLPARTRLDWAKGLDFPVPVIGQDVASAADVEYVFWVGCAGAYEDRAKRTTKAVAELLHTAGVSFGVLQGEMCTGDPARRAGNEVLFQTLAAGNVEHLNGVGATKVVVTCAHCFNTIANEYPELGGRFDVVHHTELLDRLVAEGRLRPAADDRTVTYHDPCYLARHNQVYSPPRELLGSVPGLQLAEMPRAGKDAFCCGAGGSRMWMEESAGTRINAVRSAEAVATGADVIATACPFCTVMLSDGVAANARAAAGEGSASVGVPEVADIAVLLLDRVRGAAAEQA